MNDMVTIEQLRRQQACLAAFGTFAFRESDLEKILTEAARVCAECLGVAFAKICRFRAAENDLLVVAGFGWHADVVGYVVSAANESSTQGRAFTTGEPVILEDITKNNSYALPPFYAEHDIVATADVLIKGKNGSWGVLGVDSPMKREFDEHDIVFLTGFANVVAEAVTTSERTASMQKAIADMALLIEEKDQLLLERASAERRLREVQTELLHVSRLNAMGQMTAAIAHELNQPLAAIANYVSAAKRTLEASGVSSQADTKAQELIGKAQQQTLRAGSIIKNLRDVVEKRESRRVSEDIGVIVKDSLALVLFGAEDAGIAIDLEIGTGLPPVLIDKVQIQQILVNLIRNSIEALLLVKDRRLRISTNMGDTGFANVTILDSGPGLPRNIADRLFQPFVTSKSTGMGLGLMICQTLVEANGGLIWRLDGIGGGTGFCFRLPFTDAVTDGKDPLKIAA
jgi:signal transduction histidine kinase